MESDAFSGKQLLKMDFLTSVRQILLHLNKIQEKNFTENQFLDADIKNLSSCLSESAQGEPQLDDPFISKFFHQLHHVIESSHKNQQSLQQILAIVEELVHNPRVRKALQDRGFISLLAYILQNDDHNTQILRVLQKMTKNLELKQPELYLTTLIPFLVDAINPDDLEHSRRCLRVLVNLCESRLCVDTVYKLCNMKELCKKLIANSFGLLTIRLFHSMDVRVNSTESTPRTLAAVFTEIEEFLLQEDAEACEEGFAFVQKFAAEAIDVCADTFQKHLMGLLEKLKSAEVEAVVVPGLRLFSALIKDNNSLECFNEPLMDFALDNLSYLEALHLLQALGEKSFTLGSVKLQRPPVERLSGMWKDLAGGLDQISHVDKCLATLRLLRVFVQHPQHQTNILGAVNRSSVRRLLEIPVDVSVEDLADQQILLALESLVLLTTFAAVEPQEWYGEAEEVLKTPELVQIIVEGFARRSEEMFKCCLNLAKFTKFPTDRITGLLYGSPHTVPPVMRYAPPEDTYSSLQVLQKQTNQIKDLLSEFIESPGNLTDSSAAFLQQHQDMYQQEVTKFQEEQIEAGRRQVVLLQQQIALLTAERVAMRSIICQNRIAGEKARIQNAECEKTIEEMQSSLMQIHNKLTSNVLEREEARQALQLKEVECEDAKLIIRELKDALKKGEDAKQQQIKSNEYLQKVIDEMKKEATTRSARIQHLETKVKESEAMKQKIAHFMNGL